MGKLTVLFLLVAILVENGYCQWYKGYNDISGIDSSYGDSSQKNGSESNNGDNNGENNGENSASVAAAALTQSTDKFAINFYEAVTKAHSGNSIMSSISAQTILSLLYCGASGRTASIMANGLQYQNKTQTQVAQEYHSFLAPLQAQSQIVEMANALYLMQNYEIQPKFLSTAKTDFYANVETLNFADSSGAAATINNWVSEETHGKITNLIPAQDLDATTRLVMVNAIYFHGTWQTPFEVSQTKAANFSTGNCGSGELTSVQMMHVENTFNYAFIQTLNAQVVQLPYAGTDISMVVLLPSNCNGLTALEQALQTYDISQLYNNMWSQQVILSLPKFDIDSTLNLVAPLQTLGMEQIFTRAANFSNIIESGQQPIDVSAVVQKAFIKVNEEGSTAAAATGLGLAIAAAIPIGPPPPPVIFDANHPFVFLLTTPNEILFMGRFVQ